MARQAILAAIFLTTYPQTASATGLTNAQVLQWTESNQDSYFQISITMAVFIASQNAGGRAECLNDWYYRSAEVTGQRNGQLRGTLAQYPDYHPSGTILAVLEKACGSFTF